MLTALAATPPAIAQTSTVAFTNVNVVPMDRERVLRDRTVLIRDGRIISVRARSRLPAGTRVIDGRGGWLSPGLVDMHVHSDTREDLAVYLAHGVTTIVNMGDARAGFVARTTPASNGGRLPGPFVYNAFIVDGSPEFGHFAVTTPEEARAAVGLARTNGYTFIKVYNALSAPVFDALADECRRVGMPLVGHGVTAVGLRRQAEAGQSLVAHAEEFFYTFFSAPGDLQTDAPPPRERIAEAVVFARHHQLAVGADLVTYDVIRRQIGHPEAIGSFLAASEAAYVSPADRIAWRRSGYVGKTADLRARYAFLEAMLKAMSAAGVMLLSGTDAPAVPGAAPGASLHDNLALLERAGLTRFQALATATRDSGRFLSAQVGDRTTGTVTADGAADLVLTDTNPLDGLAVLRRPRGVMRAGRWYDAEALNELLTATAASYRSATASGAPSRSGSGQVAQAQAEREAMVPTP